MSDSEPRVGDVYMAMNPTENLYARFVVWDGMCDNELLDLHRGQPVVDVDSVVVRHPDEDEFRHFDYGSFLAGVESGVIRPVGRSELL